MTRLAAAWWLLWRGGLIALALLLAACGGGNSSSTVDTGSVGTTSGGSGSSSSSSSSSSSGGETVLHSFAGRVNGSDGVDPYTGVIQGQNGLFYGLTYGGGGNGGTSFDGAIGVGVAYEISSTGTESVLHAFGADSGDAALPSALIQASDGSFYGTSFGGGGNGSAPGDGTVFRISSSGESVLHAFDVANGEGSGPNTLLQGADGNLYGTTGQGGSYNAGTVFKLTPQGTLTVLYAFGGSSGDGSGPNALIQASDGNFYGTTSSGGAFGAGTLFMLTPQGVASTLHTFGATGDDGNSPSPSSLLIGQDGNFYGATNHGGANSLGTVYRLIPGGAESVLYAFGTSTGDGANPVGLRMAGNGNFYGATSAGGDFGQGTVFSLSPAGSEAILYSFGAVALDGADPVAGPILGSDHNFYGTTSAGGAYGNGTVYRLVAAGP